MSRNYFKKTAAVILCIAMLATMFASSFTVSAACDHSYSYTVKTLPSGTADGSREGVCTKCGTTVTEKINATIDSVDYTPSGNFEYGLSRSDVGACLEDTPAPDTAFDFVKDLGGIANDPSAAEHNYEVFSTNFLKYAQDTNYASKSINIHFPEGTFYFSQSLGMYYWSDSDNESIYYGKFNFDGVKDKTTLVLDDTTAGKRTLPLSGAEVNETGFFTNYIYDNSDATKISRAYGKLHGIMQDITFTTKTYLDSNGKETSKMNFIDGGTALTGDNKDKYNIALNLYSFKMNNCTVKGFNSVFVGCSSITAPYLTNNTFEDFTDSFFDFCALVDSKITNNIIKGKGYKTSDGYMPAHFVTSDQTFFCAGIISNNKFSNMELRGTAYSRGGRTFTSGYGTAVTTFSNNLCECVTSIGGFETITLNKFTNCSKSDMTAYLKSLGSVSSSFTSKDVFVMESSQTTNSYFSDDMQETYLIHPDAAEVIENEYKFKNVQIDKLTRKLTSDSEGYTNRNIDLTMFPIQYVPYNYFYNGTDLNLNGKAVYVGYIGNSQVGQEKYYGVTSLFDAAGNDVAFTGNVLPSISEWTEKSSNIAAVEKVDGGVKLTITKNLTDSELFSFIGEFDITSPYACYSDLNNYEVVSGAVSGYSLFISKKNDAGNYIGGTAIPFVSATSLNNPYIFNMSKTVGVQSESPSIVSDARFMLRITCTASEENPVEVIIPDFTLQRYDGFANGADLEDVSHTSLNIDYSAIGADYDTVYSAIEKKNGYGNTNAVEKVYFNETYGDLRSNSSTPNDSAAIQKAFDDIKDTNKELVFEEDEYSIRTRIVLQGGSTYRVRGLGDVLFTNTVDDTMFTQTGDGVVSGYFVGFNTTRGAAEILNNGSIFTGVKFKNFIFDKCTLGGDHILFDDCTFDTSIFQGGALSKSSRMFSDSYFNNSLITDTYCHVGWISSEVLGDEGRTDAGWLFYNTGFNKSTMSNVWSEFIRFSNGDWYKDNNYPATNSLYQGNLLDYTTEIRLGAGDIAIANANYHSSVRNLYVNDKSLKDPGYDMQNRSVGTYHISSGVSVIGNAFSENYDFSPAIYFEGDTVARTSDGKVTFKNVNIYGNKYDFKSLEQTTNNVFSYEGKVAEYTPRYNVDLETCCYRNLDVTGSTGNYIDFSSINFFDEPENLIPGTVIYDSNVSGILTYDSSVGAYGVESFGGKQLSTVTFLAQDMITDFNGEAYYNGGAYAIPNVTVKDGDYELKYGTDYLIVNAQKELGATGSGNRQPKIYGLGKYTGVLSIPATVVARPIEQCNVNLSAHSMAYTGSSLKPTVTKVNYNQINLTEGTDYTVSYGENIYGKGVVIITAGTSGKLSGSKYVEFDITGSPNHNYKTTVIKPTCTEAGYTLHTCTDSGCTVNYKDNYIVATGHNYVEERTNATCTETGTVTVKCSVCGDVKSTKTVEAKGHSYKNTYVAPTCTQEGYSGRVCAVCGNTVTSVTHAATGHTYGNTTTTEGTCSTKARIISTCITCGDKKIIERELNPNKHNWTGTVTKFATCTEGGVITNATCADCGATADSVTTPALGHSVDKWTVSDSWKTGNCSNCGKQVKSSVYSWDFTDKSKTEALVSHLTSVSSVYSNIGTTSFAADDGALTISNSTSNNPRDALVFDKLATPNGSTPYSLTVTSDTTGDYQASRTQAGIIFAKDNNGYWGYITGVAGASNGFMRNIVYFQKTSGGYTVYYINQSGIEYGTVSNHPYPAIVSITDAFGNDRSAKFTKADEGLIFGMGVSYAGFNKTNRKGDSFKSTNTVTIKDGYYCLDTTLECTDISSDAYGWKFKLATLKFSLDEAEFLGHDVSNDSVTTLADRLKSVAKISTVEGLTPCFGIARAVVGEQPTSITRVYDVTAEYAMTDGSTSSCTHTNTEVRNASAATCTKDGYTGDTYCKDCGIKLASGTTIKAGHKWDSGVVTKPATTTETGIMTYTCTVCKETKTEVIPTVSCEHKNIAIDAAVAATCTTSGLTEGSHCTDCGNTIKKQEVIPALGHDYNYNVTKEATCTENGIQTTTCSRCDYSVTVDIPAKGHSWDAGVVTKPATKTETGIKTYTCTVCKETKTETIPTLGGATITWNFAGYGSDSAAGQAAVEDLLAKSTLISCNPNFPVTASYKTVTKNYTTKDSGVLSLITPSTGTDGSTFGNGPATDALVFEGLSEEAPNTIEVVSQAPLGGAWRRSEPGVVFAKDSNGGYWYFNTTIPENSTAPVYSIYYIRDYGSGNYGRTQFVVQIKAPKAIEVIDKDGNDIISSFEDPTAILSSHNWDFSSNVRFYNTVTVKDGKIYLQTKVESVVESVINSKFKSFTLEPIVLDIDDFGNNNIEGAAAMWTDANPLSVPFKSVSGLSDIGTITPVFGVARSVNSNDIATTESGEGYIYSIKAVYGAGSEEPEEPCKHAHTEVRNAKTATCTEDGYTGDTYCIDCETIITNGTTIKALGHTPEVRNAKSATCSAEGYTGDTYCSVCNTLISKGETIAKAAHTPEIRNAKPATTTEEGYTGDTYCSVCNTLISEGKKIDKLASSRVKLTVKVGSGSVNAKFGNTSKVWNVSQTVYVNASERFELTAVPHDGFEFLWWTDQNGVILTTDKTYSFIPGNDCTVIACYKETEPEDAFVIVRDPIGKKILASGNVCDGNLFAVPKYTVYGAYNFVGWFDANGNEYVPNPDNNFVVKGSVVIYARYNLRVKESYTITAIGGTPGIQKAQYNSTVTVTAEKMKDGKHFSGWYDENGHLMSTRLSYSFPVFKDMTLEAKYERDSELSVAPNVYITISERQAREEGQTLVIDVVWDVPEGCTMIKSGLVRTYNENKADNLVIGTSDSDIKSKENETNKSSGIYEYTLTMGADSSQRDLYVRGYIIYKDADGNVKTLYTDYYLVSYAKSETSPISDGGIDHGGSSEN